MEQAAINKRCAYLVNSAIQNCREALKLYAAYVCNSQNEKLKNACKDYFATASAKMAVASDLYIHVFSTTSSDNFASENVFTDFVSLHTEFMEGLKNNKPSGWVRIFGEKLMESYRNSMFCK